ALDGGVVNASFVAAPTSTTTVAVWVTATPSIVAETVFDSATVEPRVPVARPLAFVGAAGCVSVLPVPVAASTTVAPCTGLPLASRAVTVIVEVPLPAVIGDVALIVDWLADTDPAFTTTVAGCVIATPSTVPAVVCVIAPPAIVPASVFAPAAVEPTAPVAAPPASFVAAACCGGLSPVAVAASATVAP